MVDVMERPRPSLIIHLIIWPLAILAFTMIMVPLSMMVPLLQPDFGYTESSQWFMLSDSLVMYPGEWTFLLVFLLAYAVTPRSRTAPVAG